MCDLQACKLYSKHWCLREDSLKTISQTMTDTDESSGLDVTLPLLRGALVAFNRAIRDNVFAVRLDSVYATIVVVVLTVYVVVCSRDALIIGR